MKVAVIGAGPCGLTAIKCCLDEQLDVICFEQRPNIGGTWDYSDGPTPDGWSMVMKSTTLNINKEMMAFSDFPPPSEFPVFMPHYKYLEYCRMYADRFGLVKHVRFGTVVDRVSPVKDFADSGRWELTTTSTAAGSSSTEIFDAVLVCSGHSCKQFRPHFDNEEKFTGQIIHTRDYRQNDGFKGKTVVVVGAGNSGADVAVDLADVCSQVYLCARRGVWVINRIWNSGRPQELSLITRTRFKSFLVRSVYPSFWTRRLMRSIADSYVDYDLYGLRPDYEFGQQLQTINDHLTGKLSTGQVKMKQSISRLTEKGVVFTDGSTVHEVDAIICATGYSHEWPFIKHEAFGLKDGREPNLFKLIFPPDIHPSTIAMIGFIDTNVSPPGAAELQCRYATRVFKGLIKLPDAREMKRQVDKDNALARSLYLPSRRQFIMRDLLPYSDDLASAIGCRPPGFLRLLLTDRRLAMSVYTDLYTTYQYRLVGPGAWSGARDAVAGVNERLRYPLSNWTGRKQPGVSESTGGCGGFLLIALLVLAVVIGYVINAAWK